MTGVRRCEAPPAFAGMTDSGVPQSDAYSHLARFKPMKMLPTTQAMTPMMAG